MIMDCLEKSGSTPNDIDGIAYTAGPGLVGALMVGASIAKAIAYAWDKPAIGVHHMEGHLLAPMMTDDKPEYPFVALLVSGGHTLLLDCQAFGDYRMLGESVDDAAGEAFDKVAKMLGLGYPGGPAVAALATKGIVGAYRFPRPMTDRPGFNFSFSGLKTFTMNTLADIHQPTDQDRANIAAAFQEAVVDTVRIKCKRALEHTRSPALVVAGGVSANTAIRERLDKLGSQLNCRVHYPELKYCTDNGAMIAYAGLERLKAGHQESHAIEVRPRWPLSQLSRSQDA